MHFFEKNPNPETDFLFLWQNPKEDYESNEYAPYAMNIQWINPNPDSLDSRLLCFSGKGFEKVHVVSGLKLKQATRVVPLIFEMLAKLSRCSNAGAQIFEVLVKVEQSYSNARFLKKAKCSNACFFFLV